MHRSLLGFILFSALSLGIVATVNAEEIEDKVLVPFEWNGRICGPAAEDPELWACIWDPNRINLSDVITNGTETIDEPQNASTTHCPDRFTLLEDGVTCIPLVCDEGFHLDAFNYCVADNVVPEVLKDKDIIPFENKLANYEDNPPKTWSELDEKWKLEHLLKCWYGLQQSRGIQTKDSFVTSSWMEESDVPKATDASVIDRAMDICRAESTFLSLVGDAREPGDVRSRQGWFGEIQTHHSELADKVPTWSQARVNEESNIGFNNLGYCETVTWLTLETKRYMGCPDPTRPDDTIIVHSPISGGVEIQNDAEDRKTLYDLDGGKQMAKDIRAEILREKQDQLYEIVKDDNVNQQTVTEQTKEIEGKGWSLYPKDERPEICSNMALFNGVYPDNPRLNFLKVCGQ